MDITMSFTAINLIKLIDSDSNINDEDNLLYFIHGCVFMIDIITYVVAGYCCFEVSYRQYIKLCSYSHKFVYKLCEKISIYQYHSKWDKFIDKNPSWKKELDLDGALLSNDALLLKADSTT